MYLKLLFLSFLVTINCQDYENGEKATAELEIANLELQDDCENVAAVLKSSLVGNIFSEKIKVRKAHGDLVKVVAENLKPLEGEVSEELVRNWTFFVQAGDEMLNEQDWNTLVTFDVSNDEIIHTAAVHCKNDTSGCVFVKKGYDSILEESRNATLLKTAWSRWQTLVSRHKKQFPDVLNLVSKAASLNGRDDAKSYWEMLVEQEDSYRVAEDLWDQIKPLYFKLQDFVKRRLFRFYNVTDSDSDIPVYLLGSNFGTDWSKIAGIILPYPLLYQISEAYLNKTKIQDVYKSAEKLTRDLKLGPLGPKFWSNSLFNMTFCENHVISFCADEHTELLTCGKSSWTSYLDSYEVAIDVALRNMDYLSLARSNLRNSVINEAIVGMGSVIAVKNMRYRGIWGEELFVGSMSYTNEMMELLLIALRVLPKLPYYLVADKWRLEGLEHGFEDMEGRWWKLRKEFQGVEGVKNEEGDFLSDGYITSNKPYLSKFLGTLLQFQFLEYYKEEGNRTIIENIANDENFLALLHERSSTEWASLIINHHSFYDISASSLLDFFYPLNTFLDSAPIDQVFQTTPPPPTTTEPPKIPKAINQETHREHRKSDGEATEPPLPPHHEHVEENLEGPNPSMEVISMYIGIALLVAVAGIILFVIVSKKLRKKRSNNRRFET